MAKAIVPVGAYREKFGPLDAEHFGRHLHELVSQFLHDPLTTDKKHEPVRS